MMQLQNFDSKKNPTALITGGSSGLGLAIGKSLAKQGYNIIFLAREQKKIESASIELRKFGTQVIGIAADVTNQLILQEIANQLRINDIKLDFLILNAGSVLINTVMDSKLDDLHTIIENNLWGAILPTKIFINLLQENSRILFISSGLGLISGAGYASYCASKAGIIGFAGSVRRELLGIASIYVACPSDIDTPQYQMEMKSLPAWYGSSSVRKSVLSPKLVADRILKKCSGDDFLIFSDFNSYLFFSILPKILPHSCIQWLGDQLLPRPHGNLERNL